MRELTQIIDAFAELCADGSTAALATVTAIEGSSYRRPGARMLVAADGRTWGTVSGGCIERDVARRARSVIDSGQCNACCYETADSDDDALPPGEPGISLGCGGRIDILIQPVSQQSPGPLAAITSVIRRRKDAIMATVVRTQTAANNYLAQAIVFFENEVCQTLSDAHLLAAISEDLDSARQLNQLRRYQTRAGAWVDVLIERFAPPQSLLVFGDGRDAEPLVEIAKTLGWHVSLVGSSPAANLRRRFPKADVIAFAEIKKPTGELAVEEDAAAVVMAHHFQRDAAVLQELLKQPPKYIGILGPRHRTRRLLAKAGAENISSNLKNHLYWPIGLDIGARAPEQIALAIVAEIQAALSDSGGASLRDRAGPIHADRFPPRAKAVETWRI